MTTIALFGAGEKMGSRLSEKLRASSYATCYVEISATGIALLQARGLSAIAADTAARQANIVIFAVPDRHLGRIAREVIPRVKPGTLMGTLDPAMAETVTNSCVSIIREALDE